MKKTRSFFTKTRLEILSQLFTNLAAGWFGVALIVPGITGLKSFEDILWLTKNFIFGILALLIAMRLSERKEI